jgi:hypothetical protein
MAYVLMSGKEIPVSFLVKLVNKVLNFLVAAFCEGEAFPKEA